MVLLHVLHKVWKRGSVSVLQLLRSLGILEEHEYFRELFRMVSFKGLRARELGRFEVFVRV